MGPNQELTELRALVADVRVRLADVRKDLAAVRKREATDWSALVAERGGGLAQVHDVLDPTGALIRQIITKAARIRVTKSATNTPFSAEETAAIAAMAEGKSPAEIAKLLNYADTPDGLRSALDHMLQASPSETASYLVGLVEAESGVDKAAIDKALVDAFRDAPTGGATNVQRVI